MCRSLAEERSAWIGGIPVGCATMPGCLPDTYETPRIARVPSKALATTSSCLTFSVFVFYMLGTVVLYQKRYLALESPDGTARLQLENPTPELLADDTSQLSYCNGGAPAAGQIPNQGKNYTGELALTRPCQFRDQYFSWYPQIEHNAMFATTRVTESEQTLPTDCASGGGSRMQKECVDWDTTSTEVFFVAQLEDFTILIDHSFTAALAKQTAAASDPSVKDGWICRACTDDDDLLCSDACAKDSANVVDPCDDYTSRGLVCPDIIHVGSPRNDPKCASTGCRDIIPLRTLLRAVRTSIRAPSLSLSPSLRMPLSTHPLHISSL